MRIQTQSIKRTAGLLFKSIAISGLATSALNAEESSPWDIRFFGGIDKNLSGSLVLPGETKDVDFGVGVVSGGVLSYELSSNFSLGLEYSWRRSGGVDLDATALGAAGELDVASVSIAPRIEYRPDWKVWSDKLQPRLALGYGFLQEVSMDFETAAGEEEFSGDGSVLQLALGFNYALSEKWSLDAEALYYHGGSVDVESANNAARKISYDYSGLSFTLGATYQF